MDNTIKEPLCFSFEPFGLLTLFKRNGKYFIKPEFKCNSCKMFSMKEMDADDFIKESSIILERLVQELK